MIPKTKTQDTLIEDLGDGLILRHATPADAETLGDFNSRVHSDDGWDNPEIFLYHWTHDSLTKPHPTLKPADFLIVEDTVKGRIASTMNLIPQTWTYAGIPFGVGRPELVATHPDYRNRGLVRKQFEIVHRWSAERGHLVQAITGIPWYYRQYGYEMAVELSGGRRCYASLIPVLKEGEEDPYRLRKATAADIPFLKDLYTRGTSRSLLACPRDEALWQLELGGRSPGASFHLSIMETPEGEPVGFTFGPDMMWGGALPIWWYEVAPGHNWQAVTNSALRGLKALGEQRLKEQESDKDFEQIYFVLGSQHPLFEVIPHRLPGYADPYAWYLRVPDLPAFLRHIGPALEARLAASYLPGYSGDLMLNFYRTGVRLIFEHGRLTTVDTWQPTTQNEGHVAFPDRTFIQMLFGYRGLDELEAAFPDCWVDRDSPDHGVLARVLFPKSHSDLWALQ
ncbi:MAG: GNAT family N-acetyltransferase [Anaerolineae bacterium]|nr:MAG: GNAT family N-acetyltransferase [Anaerolineae bacterium]